MYTTLQELEAFLNVLQNTSVFWSNSHVTQYAFPRKWDAKPQASKYLPVISISDASVAGGTSLACSCRALIMYRYCRNDNTHILRHKLWKGCILTWKNTVTLFSFIFAGLKFRENFLGTFRESLISRSRRKIVFAGNLISRLSDFIFSFLQTLYVNQQLKQNQYAVP